MTTVDFLGEPLDGNGTRIMTANAKGSDVTKRRLRLGMVGGGPGAFIGSVHRLAARMDDHFELVAAAFTSHPERRRAAALDPPIPPGRGFGSFWEIAAGAANRPERI